MLQIPFCLFTSLQIASNSLIEASVSVFTHSFLARSITVSASPCRLGKETNILEASSERNVESHSFLMSETICKELNKQNGICNVKVDLSLIGEEEYYNGVIFSGYVKGVPARVLSGGRYDALLEKLGKDCGAIGFALYFDELEQFYSNIGGNC